MYQNHHRRGQAMQTVNVTINDTNSPKKLSAFLEKLIAQTIFELYCADEFPFKQTMQKVDNPHD